MAEPRNLREKLTAVSEETDRQRAERRAAFRAPILAAADEFLKQLALTIAAETEKKVLAKDVSEMPLNRYSGEKTPIVTFSHPSLFKVTREEVLKMDGWRALNEACAQPEVDMCLGRPYRNSNFMLNDDQKPFCKVAVYFKLGADESEYARQKPKEFSVAAQKERAGKQVPPVGGPVFGTKVP